MGDVLVKFKPNARRFIARWATGHVDLTAPAMATEADAIVALDRLAPRLLACRHSDVVRFHDGQEIRLDGLVIAIVRQDFRCDNIFVSQRYPGYATVSVGASFDFGEASTTQVISKALKTIARKNASNILLHIFMGFNTLVISVFHPQSCTKVVRDEELGETPIK